MKLKKSIKNNPKTSVVTVLTAITALWDQLSENAELFGMSSKTVMIIGVVLSTGAMVYNMFNKGESIPGGGIPNPDPDPDPKTSKRK